MLREERVLLTDTAMRDAHQSLLATRMRSIDLTAIAPYYASLVPQLFSVECWGGATFDVALRFLREDPWERLSQLRAALPNLLLQMLLRAANAVGYANYPDEVVRLFIARAAAGGIDLFRIFDSLNWVENMRVSIDAVLEAGKLCEAAICYTGNLGDPHERKYTLDYYLQLARQLKAAGTHVLGIKDMGGLCRPRAAYTLVKALREETGLPVHFHTHDTSGIAAASVLAAVEAGADAVDGAIDALSRAHLAAEPRVDRRGAAPRAARFRHRSGPAAHDLGLLGAGTPAVRGVRERRARRRLRGVRPRHARAASTRTCASRRARSASTRRAGRKSSATYAEVNAMFGDIIKVTPTSKAVGDMALLMVTSGLKRAQVEDPATEVAFPESVVQLFRGELGQAPGGFPEASAAQDPQGRRAAHDPPRRGPAAGGPGGRARAHPAGADADGDR